MCWEKENLKQAHVNTAGLRLPVLGRPAPKVGTWLTSSACADLKLSSMLRVPRWVSAVCTVWFMLKIHSPSGSLESQKMSDRGGLRDQPGVLSLQRVSPGDDTHVCCHSLLLEELSVVYEALLKGGPEAGPRFPPDCTLSTFGLC